MDDNCINKLIEKVEKTNFTEKEINLIKKSIFFAEEKHANQLRKSNEPYIIHPIAVANILLDWELDYLTICAGLLHDVIEDTNTTVEEINDIFGEKICFLVDSLTKISKFSGENRMIDSYNNENSTYIIKIFVSMAKDIRVMIVKLADRFHNMNTISFLSPEKQKRMARETIEIYTNIAGRLGLFEVKTTLEDICFKILEPIEYENTIKIIENKKLLYKNVFKELMEKLNIVLIEQFPSIIIKSRIKSVYSSYKKIKIVDDIPDIFGVRVIVKTIQDCYSALGTIHTNFFNTKDTFKDFISTPKYNLYQSLHTGIFFKGTKFEVQIRTEDMEATANLGIAAHWKYKEKIANNDLFKMKYNTISDEIINLEIEDEHKLNEIKKIANEKTNFIYCNNIEEWKETKQNITALDFAFLLDQDKFNYVEKVLINGQRGELSQKFYSGDFISVQYSEKETLNKLWLNFCNEAKTKKYIQSKLTEIFLSIETSSAEFINILNKKCGQHVTKKFVSDLTKKHFDCNNIREFIEITKIIQLPKEKLYDLFSNDKVKNKIIISEINKQSSKWLLSKSLFKNVDNIYFNKIVITSCCSKIPPMDIIGILNNDALEVHRHDCFLIENTVNKRVVLSWDKDKIKISDRGFKSRIILDGIYNQFVSNDVISTFTKYKGTISSFVLQKDKVNKTFKIEATIYIKNYSNLEKIMMEL